MLTFQVKTCSSCLVNWHYSKIVQCFYLFHRVWHVWSLFLFNWDKYCAQSYVGLHQNRGRQFGALLDTFLVRLFVLQTSVLIVLFYSTVTNTVGLLFRTLYRSRQTIAANSREGSRAVKVILLLTGAIMKPIDKSTKLIKATHQLTKEKVH